MIALTTRPELKENENLATTTRITLVVEYDGTNYYGSQLQANRPTIQSELEKALASLTGEKVRISAASRTDTGVHARGQVISFKTDSTLPVPAFVHGLNHFLPEAIAVKTAYRTAISFYPRRMAVSREYTYTILNSTTRSPLTARFAHRITGDLDIEAMNRACRMLVGTRDFASFASDIGDEPSKSTVRHIFRADFERNGNTVVFTIIANAFLRHQVRNTAGALVQVGSGKMSTDQFKALIDARQPGSAGPALPACGLCLVRVNYPCAIEEMK